MRKSLHAINALGRLPDGVMNKTEAAYEAEILKPRMLAGEIIWYKFESMKFKLAKKTTYTPDFNVMLANGQMEMHEVKGFWRDDARAKIKIAAEMFPFKFVAIQKKSKKSGWTTEEF